MKKKSIQSGRKALSEQQAGANLAALQNPQILGK
jgi:hypothetical protein